MSYNYTPCFNKIDVVVIPCYIELPRKKSNYMSGGTSLEKLEICGFLGDSAISLKPQFSFLAARQVGLLLRAPWPNSKRFIWEHANWMVFYKKMWKIFPPTLPTSSPPQSILYPPFLAYLRCFHLLQIITTSPFQFKNFVRVANPLLLRHPCN